MYDISILGWYLVTIRLLHPRLRTLRPAFHRTRDVLITTCPRWGWED